MSDYGYARNNPVRYIHPSGLESQPAVANGENAPGFCAKYVVGSAAIILAFSVLDTAIGFVTLFAPESHALPPVQALDLIAIGGTLGGIGGVVYGYTHACGDAR